MAPSKRNVLIISVLLSVFTLGGCAVSEAPPPSARPTLYVPSSPRPHPKPVEGPIRDLPIASSAELAQHYELLQARMLDQGYLREDEGDISELTAEALAGNFIRIALFDEYTDVGGAFLAQESESRLRRWEQPVAINVEFGASVTEAQRTADTEEIRSLANTLSEASHHPVTLSDRESDFTVFVVDETERLALSPKLRHLVPGISDPVIHSMLDILPSTFCLVVAFSSPEAPQTYMRAIAIVRAEHPAVLRRGCFHEEIAQGLGLANDSHSVRPSIFNDDEEFALLTAQDRLFLRILYDPRLRPGMDALEAAEPIRTITMELIPMDVAALTPADFEEAIP